MLPDRSRSVVEVSPGALAFARGVLPVASVRFCRRPSRVHGFRLRVTLCRHMTTQRRRPGIVGRPRLHCTSTRPLGVALQLSELGCGDTPRHQPLRLELGP